MLVLALDTTTRAGSVAIVEDDRIVDERGGDATRTHAERLPGELVALVDAHGLSMANVDLFAIASGPGSFTGLRIGIATMQGLALVSGRRVVGVPALEGLAQVASRDAAADAYVAAWMDAHRRDVFAALYRVTAAPLFDPDRLVEVEAPTVGEPSTTLARWNDRLEMRAATFIGDGAMLYEEAIGRDAPGRRVMPPPLLAGAIGRLAVHRARRGEAVGPSAVRPLYVRRPDAEVAREKASP
jgi:tRNA threonylcarbamoyladenosine biosynthesis protein TsaB